MYDIIIDSRVCNISANLSRKEIDGTVVPSTGSRRPIFFFLVPSRQLLLTFPLRFGVVDVYASLLVKQVTRWLECLGNGSLLRKSKQGAKRQPHVFSFVGNGSATMRTAHLDRELTVGGFLAGPTFVGLRVVEMQILERGWLEAHVILVIDGHPFKGGAME